MSFERQEIDISNATLTVEKLIELLSDLDQNALVLMADETNPIHLEFHKIVQMSQPNCQGEKFNTVYLQVED